MSEKHPYAISHGPLIQVINHLRKSFPSSVTADTLKKLGYAKKNESYVINTLRFIGVIDESGSKTDKAAKVFSQHEDNAFQKEFSKLIEASYKELFSLHKDAWTLDADALITFFRQTDQSSSLVGKKQANTFKAFAGLSGHIELPDLKAKRTVSVGKAEKKVKKKQGVAKEKKEAIDGQLPPAGKNPFGLTVRVEINLPADGDQETYDRIFQSIRENLLNG
jgi:hypothetical protein